MILVGFDEGSKRARVVLEMTKEVSVVTRHVHPHPL